MTLRTPLPPVPPLPQNAVQPLTPPQRTTPPTLQAPSVPSGYAHAPQASGYGPPPPSQQGYAAPSGYGPPPTAYAPPAPPAPTGYGPPPASYAPATQMSGYGAPPPPMGHGAPLAPTGYGAPPAPSGYGAPPAPTGYGAPPAQAGYGSLPPLGWQASAPSYGAPPNAGAKQSGVPKAAIIGGGIAAAFVMFGAIGVGAWAILRTSHKPLPVAAAKLPSDTDFFHEDRFPGADGAPAVRDAFLASDLARHVCGAGSDFADRVMRLRTSPSDAVTLFDPKTIEARKATLACGQQLLGALETPAFTELVFHDGDDKKFLGVEMLRLNVTELPAKFGFAKQTFSGFAGQCLVSPKKTEPDFKWSATTNLKVEGEKEKDGECNDTSLAAFHDGPTWFFGQRRAIEAFARSYAKPREELSTTVENLQLAFDSGEGLAVRRADARPKAASSLLKLPCSHAAFDSGAGSKFIEECLPKSVEKNASSIDAKVRAVTYELAAPIQDSDGIRFNMFFVARDNDAAKDVENELKDAARDWKSSIENDEANLAKMVREAPSQLGQRKWSVAIETFVRAIKHGTVSRNGRVVAFKLSEKFSSNEQKEMREVMSKSTEDQQALATITQALVKNQPVPEATLAQITGPEWASIALAPRLTDKECAPLREKLNRFDMTNPAAVPHALRFAIRIKCEGQPMPAASLACLNAAKDAQAFGKCSLPTNPLDPTKLGSTTGALGTLDGAKAKSILQ